MTSSSGGSGPLAITEAPSLLTIFTPFRSAQFSLPITDCRCGGPDRVADPHPPDQSHAASPRAMGGYGVFAPQPEAQPHLGIDQAIAVATAADCRHRRCGDDGGAAAVAE